MKLIDANSDNKKEDVAYFNRKRNLFASSPLSFSRTGTGGGCVRAVSSRSCMIEVTPKDNPENKEE
jgi:hypothetical protein